jgi:hypothetical protein
MLGLVIKGHGNVDRAIHDSACRRAAALDDLAGLRRQVLDPHSERPAPAGLYWPGSDGEPRRMFGLGGRTRRCRSDNYRGSALVVTSLVAPAVAVDVQAAVPPQDGGRGDQAVTPQHRGEA